MLTINKNNTANILAERNNFCSQANYCLAHFGHLPIIFQCTLFVNFCYALCGCQLWDLGHNELKHFDTVW